MNREDLKPSEQGSKCPKHNVFYQTEFQEFCCKTVQFCPECRLEQYKPFLDFISGADRKEKA